MTSQSDIVAAFKEGRFEGCSEVPLYIETVISHIFLSGTRAYKLCKDDNAFFNAHFFDLADSSVRNEFVEADFTWNHAVTPEIYETLCGARLIDGRIEFIGPDESEHRVVAMQRFDLNDGLLRLLVDGSLANEDFHRIGTQLGDRIDTVCTKHPEIDLYKNFVSRFSDLRAWISGLETEIPDSERFVYVDYLESFLEANTEWLTRTEDASSVLDTHAENGVYAEQRLLLIDTYPPQENWRYCHQDFNRYRLATDVYALAGREAFEAVLLGYQERMGTKPDPVLEPFFVVYAGAIMVPYLYSLGRTSDVHLQAARMYRAFLQHYFNSIPKD
ncbi:MAG: hypothetical protein AB199_03255 [Parcubacteria bacterium C7867-004]|nr:MAG: hypothetical protein AB199_03255 [Parcubacteria bacterium C7867-004]